MVDIGGFVVGRSGERLFWPNCSYDCIQLLLGGTQGMLCWGAGYGFDVANR